MCRGNDSHSSSPLLFYTSLGELLPLHTSASDKSALGPRAPIMVPHPGSTRSAQMQMGKGEGRSPWKFPQLCTLIPSRQDPLWYASAEDRALFLQTDVCPKSGCGTQGPFPTVLSPWITERGRRLTQWDNSPGDICRCHLSKAAVP